MGKIISNGIEYSGSSIINEINGVFIDTDNVIDSGSYNPSNPLNYTATEDCVALITLISQSNHCYVYVDSINIYHLYTDNTTSMNLFVPLKKGQVLTASTAFSAESSGYTVYGIQQGSQDTTKNEIYSTEERAIGTWVDGSTIYEKTIYHTGGVTGYISILHGITNLNRVISLEGSALDYYTSEGDLRISNMILPRIALDDNNIGISSITNTEVQLSVGSIWSDRVRDIYITLKYTKTTT